MRRTKNMKRYLVKELIYHTGLQEYCLPGAVVDLSHLSDEEISELVAQGVVEEFEENKGDE